MTEETLRRANALNAEIGRIESFLTACKNNYFIRLFNKPKRMGVTVSDYMREIQYFELTREQREKVIKMLQEEYDLKRKEIEQLKGGAE